MRGDLLEPRTRTEIEVFSNRVEGISAETNREVEIEAKQFERGVF